MREIIVENFRFTNHQPGGDHGNHSILNVWRASDGHSLSPQVWFDHELSLEELEVAAATWIASNPGKGQAPPETRCAGCAQKLESTHDTSYQFDNALWIGFYGGYGMFTDEIGQNNNVLQGNPDHEVVICHECAHLLCEEVPWIGDLIQPESSHSHKVVDHPVLKEAGHQGWDLSLDTD